MTRSLHTHVQAGLEASILDSILSTLPSSIPSTTTPHRFNLFVRTFIRKTKDIS